MYLLRTALAVGLIYNFVLVKGQSGDNKKEVLEKENEDEKNEGNVDSKEVSDEKNEEVQADSNLLDNHSFVALIDVVFTDGSKRTCTGAIIHDNVVLTAAHCFKSHSNIQPELTASFVVIGTKVMFDTEYEQYLPIERVITHPKYRGWTADLCLVYTFAGMTSDKPGTIIPLAGEKTSAYVDNNVTVLSWGHLKSSYHISKTKMNGYNYHQLSTLHNRLVTRDVITTSSCESNLKSESKEDEEKIKETYLSTLSMKLRSRLPKLNRIAPSKLAGRQFKKIPQVRLSMNNAQASKLNKRKNKIPYNPLRRERAKNQYDTTKLVQNVHSNRYWTYKKQEDNDRNENESAETSGSQFEIPVRNSDEGDRGLEVQDEAQFFNIKSYYGNWRRQMGGHENKLSVDNFVFVNLQSCKQLVEKAMPGEYDISKNNDVVCYTNDGLQVGDDDSGAPAIRHGHLVAITVGVVYNEGDRVAIGMKMSCYCSWITENLPSDGKIYKCCKNCCNVKHKKEIKELRKKKHQYDFSFL